MWINGIMAARLGGFTAEYTPARMSDEARSSLKPGKNTIAIHCNQNGGGQYVDAGLAEVVSTSKKNK